MTSNQLDGKKLSKFIEATIQAEIQRTLSSKIHNAQTLAPGLGVILVGDNPASQAYVATKEKLAQRVGIRSYEQKLPSNATFEQVAQVIQGFNSSPDIHGILLQLPLPSALAPRQNELLNLIDPAKDADGLHPINQGLLMKGEAYLKPCTPMGAMKLIDLAYNGIQVNPDNIEIPEANLAGRKVIVIGRSILVGKPVAMLCLERNATVIMAHSKTANLPDLCRTADIVIAAVGNPLLVKKNWIQPGAIVIDVGINRTADGKLVGDVDFENVAPLCHAITPVPGGVGPMTVVMLIQNTWNAYKKMMKI